MLQGPPAAQQTDTVAGSGDLCYRWKAGEQYFYRISCKAEINDMLLETTGANTYSVGQATAPGASAGTSEDRPGSGTAFVVSTDGYLLTCDHVVRNATDIQVKLGDQTSPCQVIARDSAHDLALIHIARQGLPAIPLADSEAVELAEEVRAVGFPLSDVLGSSIKVTRGSVAGIVAKRRGKVFQIDAVVNPGNSGGPLLDGRGAVVGVVNAQLVGLQISKVGFAVPVNYAKAMLAKHHVKFQTATGSKLDGPALAKRVSPSVGLVTMTCHGDDFSGEDRLTLTYHGFLDHRKQTKAAAAAALAPQQIDSSERDDGRLVVDEYGEISQFRGQVNLPCLLGPLGSVAIDPLPAEGEKTWQRREMLTIRSTSQGPYDPLAGLRPPGYRGPRFGPRWFPFGGPFGEPEEVTSFFPAVQQTSYTAEDPKGTTRLIRKRLELKTLEKTEAGPKVELTGNGETLFDLKAGASQKVTFSGTLFVRANGQTTKIPLTLTCERSTGNAPSPAAAPPGTVAATGAAPLATTLPPRPQNAESARARLDDFLTDLRAVEKDWGKCFRALQGLSMMKPIEARREEVAEVLDKYLAEPSYSARSSALGALRGWGARRNVPALIALLTPLENESLRRRAIELLGSLRDGQAAPAIAQRMKDPVDRMSASQALRALGPAAEDATLALLADEDAEVRDEACKVLGEIGGAKSIAALKEQAAKPDAVSRGVAKATREAVLDQLQKRQKQ